MRFYFGSIFLLVLVVAQSQAFLQEKLALLKSLKSGLEGGFGSGGNYGGSYGGSYGGGNGGGYNYPAPSRPLYSGGESYGRSSYYNTGNAGGEQVIKVIKVVVPAQENSYASSGYNGVSSYSSGGGYATSWTPSQQPQIIAPQPVQISQPNPVQYRVPVQTAQLEYGIPQQAQQIIAPQPVQISQPNPVQYRVPQLPPVQTAQVEYGAPQPAPVQVQQSVELPQPVQYTNIPQQVVQPQPVSYSNSVYQQPQTVVKTLKLIVSEEGNRQVASYASAPVSSSYNSGYGANSASWTNQGQNNIGGALWGKGWQRGGIWQKLGC